MAILKPLTRIAGACLIAASLITAPPTLAHDTKAGDLTIDQAHARPNLPNRPSAAYLKITNMGETADRLLAVNSKAFATIELHSVEHQDGVMKMMPIEAVEIPAGGTALLQPGGMHLMLFDAARRFKVGDHFKATLTFEKAGEVTVLFMVEKPKPGAKTMDHGNHGSGS